MEFDLQTVERREAGKRDRLAPRGAGTAQAWEYGHQGLRTRVPCRRREIL